MNWTNKELDNLALCIVRMKARKEWIRLNHMRAIMETKKIPLPLKLTLTGSV